MKTTLSTNPFISKNMRYLSAGLLAAAMLAALPASARTSLSSLQTQINDVDGRVSTIENGDTELRVGNTAAICTVGMSGALQWNPTEQKMQVCDGSSWNLINDNAGSTLSQRNLVQRDFLVFSHSDFLSPQLQTIHIKTSLLKSDYPSAIKNFRLLVEGYNTGTNTTINAEVGGSMYSHLTSLFRANGQSHTAAISSITPYITSDGYLAIRLDSPGLLSFGFTVSGWFGFHDGSGVDFPPHRITGEVFLQTDNL